MDVLNSFQGVQATGKIDLYIYIGLPDPSKKKGEHLKLDDDGVKQEGEEGNNQSKQELNTQDPKVKKSILKKRLIQIAQRQISKRRRMKRWI